MELLVTCPQPLPGVSCSGRCGASISPSRSEDAFVYSEITHQNFLFKKKEREKDTLCRFTVSP